MSWRVGSETIDCFQKALHCAVAAVEIVDGLAEAARAVAVGFGSMSVSGIRLSLRVVMRVSGLPPLVRVYVDRPYDCAGLVLLTRALIGLAPFACTAIAVHMVRTVGLGSGPWRREQLVTAPSPVIGCAVMTHSACVLGGV